MFTICTVLLFLAALCLTLYPLISNYVNQKYASQIHTAYQEVMEQVDDAALLRTKELAVAYNRSIVPGASTEDAYSQEGLLAASADYDSQLNIAGNGIMGYVEIPKISVNLPIYHGTENDSLERGIGHLLGSSLPVGGESTHTILSGHSGMASQKMLYVVAHKLLNLFYGAVVLARLFPNGEKRSWRTRRPARYRRNVPVACYAAHQRPLSLSRNNRLCRPVTVHRFRCAVTERQIAHNGKRGKGTRSPHGLKDYPT